MKISNLKFQISNLFRKLKNFFHLFIAILANIIYGFPSKKIKVIGVTGTDGKTTTTHLIYHILKTSGVRVSMVSTICGLIGDKIYETGLHTTTPSSFMIQNLLNQAVRNGDDYFVLEVTSHGLDQNRVWGVNFEIGVLTNITHEHLDYHGSYENYVKAKCRLFEKAKYGILNKDDESYQLVLSKIKNKKLKIKSYTSKLKILNKISNLTRFNKNNYAAGYTTAKILKIPEKLILKGLKTFKLPKGRLEVVYDKSFKVIIDFAHTPNAFKNLLPEIKKNYLINGGRIIHVFGCAGLRDIIKRELMGEISASFCDVIIITEEDYRTENPENIVQQIKKGIERKNFEYREKNQLKDSDKKIFTVVLNREEAIDLAIKTARKNDIVLLTGKAHERSLCRGRIEYDWDEFSAVKESLKKFNKG